MTAAAIIRTAVSEKLSLIAVTDHNEIANVGSALGAAADQPVTVIPGVELSTPEGHLLVYFGKIEDLSSFYGSLKIVGKGTNESRCQTSLLECLNKIDIKKGFAILAHVDAAGGFEKKVSGNPPHKRDIINHESLMGIELRSATSTIYYSDGDSDSDRRSLGQSRIAALSLGSQQFLARVLFSDSHALSALGKNALGRRRLTRIKMDTPSFAGLRVALQDADARIRIEEEIPQSVPYVLGMSLEGNFLDGQIIHFSRNLNCIIGGRGAGKSTVFEAVRCLATAESTNPLVDSEVWPDNIRLIWVDEAGQQHTIRRRIGDESENLSSPEIGSLFPIESYGQNETAQTSVKAQNDPSALLKYMDQFIDIAGLQAEDDELRILLLSNQTDIEKASTNVKRIPEYKKLLAAVKQQLKTLETAQATEVVRLERKIAEERMFREGIERQVAELGVLIKDSSLLTALETIETVTTPEELRVGTGEFRSIVALTKTLRHRAQAAEKGLVADVATFSVKVKEHLTSWKASEQQIRTKIDEKRKQLLAEGIKLDLAYIKKLATDESTYQKALTTLSAWKTRLKDLQKARLELLGDRSKVHSRIFTTRNSYAAKANRALKNALTDLDVSVKYVEGGLSAEGEEIVLQATNWRTSQVPRSALLVEQVTVAGLLQAVRKNDPTTIMNVTALDGMKPFSRNEALSLINALNQEPVVFRLERCLVDDRPKITVTKKIEASGKRPTFVSRDFSKLSLGQQQSVLLALMLSSESEAPLIIDQPEDNLDSEFIFHSLVPVIRAAKERRQVIIVTHNANIAVLGDAEQIIALKSTSDKSIIVASGSIDEPDTKSVVCRILEGAEEAFRRRAKIYGVI